MKTFLSKLLLVVLDIYQMIISPMIHLVLGAGHGCRYEVSCSDFSKKMIQQQGPWMGSWLSLKRVLSCHPFSRGM